MGTGRAMVTMDVSPLRALTLHEFRFFSAPLRARTKPHEKRKRHADATKRQMTHIVNSGNSESFPKPSIQGTIVTFNKKEWNKMIISTPPPTRWF
jgi:hypothetical protein